MSKEKKEEVLETEIRQNSSDIRGIVSACIVALATVLLALLCYWVGSISGKVDTLQVHQATNEATLSALKVLSDERQASITSDHVEFKEWLKRIEGKIDTLSQKVYSTN